MKKLLIAALTLSSLSALASSAVTYELPIDVTDSQPNKAISARCDQIAETVNSILKDSNSSAVAVSGGVTINFAIKDLGIASGTCKIVHINR